MDSEYLKEIRSYFKVKQHIYKLLANVSIQPLHSKRYCLITSGAFHFKVSKVCVDILQITYVFSIILCNKNKQ